MLKLPPSLHTAWGESIDLSGFNPDTPPDAPFDPAATFPRSNWYGNPRVAPPFRARYDDDLAITCAARRASTLWANNGGPPDPNGYILAVMDKVYEMLKYARSDGPAESIEEWRGRVEEIIERALQLAGPSDVTRDVAIAFLRGGADAMYENATDSWQTMKLEDRRPVDLAVLQGYEEPEPDSSDVYVPKYSYPAMPVEMAAAMGVPNCKPRKPRTSDESHKSAETDSGQSGRSKESDESKRSDSSAVPPSTPPDASPSTPSSFIPRVSQPKQTP